MTKVCGLLVDSLCAWSSRDCFQVNISNCGLYAVKSKCVTALLEIAKGVLILYVQLHCSDLALTVHCL